MERMLDHLKHGLGRLKDPRVWKNAGLWILKTLLRQPFYWLTIFVITTSVCNLTLSYMSGVEPLQEPERIVESPIEHFVDQPRPTEPVFEDHHPVEVEPDRVESSYEEVKKVMPPIESTDHKTIVKTFIEQFVHHPQSSEKDAEPVSVDDQPAELEPVLDEPFSEDRHPPSETFSEPEFGESHDEIFHPPPPSAPERAVKVVDHSDKSWRTKIQEFASLALDKQERTLGAINSRLFRLKDFFDLVISIFIGESAICSLLSCFLTAAVCILVLIVMLKTVEIVINIFKFFVALLRLIISRCHTININNEIGKFAIPSPRRLPALQCAQCAKAYHSQGWLTRHQNICHRRA